MRIQILLFVIICALTSCVSTKTYSGYVETKILKLINQSEIQSEDIIFDLTKLNTQTNLVESEKVKSFFIPAILYWGWENTIECKVDPFIVGNEFKSCFVKCASAYNLYKELDGQKIEISIEKIPTSFLYTHKGNIIIYIISYSMSDLEAIFPQEQNLVINYKLTKDGQLTKSSQLLATNNDKPITNYWKSTKKFTWLYVDQLFNNLNTLTDDIVKQLVKEI